MIKLFGRGDDKEKKQFTRDVTTATIGGRAQGRSMAIASKQQLDSLGRAYYLQEDENVLSLLLTYFPELMPAFSRLNSTSRITTQKDKRILLLDFQNLLLECRMELYDDDEYYGSKLALLQSLEVFAQFRLHDAWEGYRGKLVTEEIERTTVQVTEPEKKRLL